MWICIIQISTNEFVRIYNWQIQKKLLSFKKNGFPLEPRCAKMCTFSTKKLRHWRIQFETPAGTIFVFVPGHHPRFETYTNPCPCQIANPFCKQFILAGWGGADSPLDPHPPAPRPWGRFPRQLFFPRNRKIKSFSQHRFSSWPPHQHFVAS